MFCVYAGNTNITDDLTGNDPPMTHPNNNHTDYEQTITPEGTKYWTPECSDDIKPYVGQQFADFKAAGHFYDKYAATSGFDTRRGTSKNNRGGEKVTRYIYCSHEGFKHVAKKDTKENTGMDIELPTLKKPIRRSVSNRAGCKARIRLKAHNTGGVYIHAFEDRHTHELSAVESRPFLKVNRKLSNAHQKFVATCARASIGPTKSYRLYKEMVGGYGNIGATSVDFRNFKSLAYISGGDAQLIIDNLFKKQETNARFFFEYDVDEYD